MHLFEKKWSDLADLRIVSGADSCDNPMRTARSIEQPLMSKVLHDIDAKTGGAIRACIPRDGAQRLSDCV
jgi:hypothetical protein